MASSTTENPIITTTDPQDKTNTIIENVLIAAVVILLVVINISLFLFWRSRAFRKSPLRCQRYLSNSEDCQSLQQPVEDEDPKRPFRVQDVLKKYAVAVASVGNHATSSASNSTLTSFVYASSSNNSRSSLIMADTDGDAPQGATSKQDTDKCASTIREPEIKTISSENKVRFALGDPEEDSSDADIIKSFEVITIVPPRKDEKLRPVSFAFCKDSCEVSDSSNGDLTNSKELPGLEHGCKSPGINIIDETKFHSPNKHVDSTSSTLPNHNDADQNSSNVTCMISHDAETGSCSTVGKSPNKGVSLDKKHGSDNGSNVCSSGEMHSSRGNAEIGVNSAFEISNVEQLNANMAANLYTGDHSDLSRITSPSKQSQRPIHHYPSTPECNNPHNRNCSDNLATDHQANHNFANRMPSSQETKGAKARKSGAHPSHLPEIQDSMLTPNVDGANLESASPHATSPGVAIPDMGTGPFHNTFESHGFDPDDECLDDYDPEESFPVIQMLSDRYSTGNFLNKFY